MNIEKETKLRIYHPGFDEEAAFALTEWDYKNKKMTIAKFHEFVPKIEGGLNAPSFTLGKSAVQELFNEMWNLGYRPSDGIREWNRNGEIAAMHEHIADFRRLAFGKNFREDKSK